MKRLNILIYVDQNLNLLDRSSQWLTTMANIITSDDKVDVSILLRKPISSKEVKFNITNNSYVKWIKLADLLNKNVVEDDTIVDEDICNAIERLDEEKCFDVVILSGKTLIAASLSREYSKKTIPYIHDIGYFKTRLLEKSTFKRVLQKYPNVLVPSERTKNILTDLFKVTHKKLITIPVSVKDNTTNPAFKNRRYTISYQTDLQNIGTLKELSNIFTSVKAEDSAITLAVIGKVESDQLVAQLKNTEGIDYVGTVSQEELSQQLDASDMGYCYKETKETGSFRLEDWIKFLKYGISGKPVILRRTKDFEQILGKDYPLFANSIREVKEKIILVFNNPDVYRTAAEKCFEVSDRHRFSVVRKRFLDQLWKYNTSKQTILFVGHEFKFLHWYMDACQKNDMLVLIDKWNGHSAHDEKISQTLLRQADIIFCEWGLGNAVYYSKHKLRGQKLFIRVHRQELETVYLEQVIYKNVTNVITISPYIMEEFHRIKKIPRNKLKLIPNMVDIDNYKRSKEEETSYNLGILGIIPKLKRIDRAVEILEKLWKIDQRYKLFIKGKLPRDLSWMKSRKDELSYYDDVFEKIENAPWKDNVIFDEHGDDVAQWFRKINFILSTSDIEGFHLAPMEGMAGGTMPIIFNWAGSDMIYPEEVIVSDIDEAVELIIKYTKKDQIEQLNFQSVVEKYNRNRIVNKLNELIFD